MPSETQLEDHETKRRKKSFTNYEEDFPLREVGE